MQRLADDPKAPFPDPAACKHPDGLVAYGGDLSVERVLLAYENAIFPWYSAGSPILWWSPDPRPVFDVKNHVPNRRLRRTLRKPWHITLDSSFGAVIRACAAPRAGQPDTWITHAMIGCYEKLHELGFAHSVEVWWEGQLAGGLYGVSLGRVFFAESKFHRVRDASKVALIHLIAQLRAWDFSYVDCQVISPHLENLGATLLSRRSLQLAVSAGLAKKPTHPHHLPGLWSMDP